MPTWWPYRGWAACIIGTSGGKRLTRRAQQPGPLGERLRAIEPLLDQPGVLPEGMLSEEEMHRLRARCLAMLYPLDPVMPHSELLSLAVLEAYAAGVPPILAPVDCFPSEYGQVARMVEELEPDYRPQAWIRAVEQVFELLARAPSSGRVFRVKKISETVKAAWRDATDAGDVPRHVCPPQTVSIPSTITLFALRCRDT